MLCQRRAALNVLVVMRVIVVLVIIVASFVVVIVLLVVIVNVVVIGIAVGNVIALACVVHVCSSCCHCCFGLRYHCLLLMHV